MKKTSYLFFRSMTILLLGIISLAAAYPAKASISHQGQTAGTIGIFEPENRPFWRVGIIKYTNGQLASDPDGADVPLVNPGDLVEWTYLVTNTGINPIPRELLSVTDDQPGVTPVFDREVSGNGDNNLDLGEVWLYIATGVAVNLLAPPAGVTTVPGVCTGDGARPPSTAYVNRGTATIPEATASADSSYCNPPAPAISIVKRTNGQIASDPDGADVPQIEPGDPVVWTYEVTNTGNVPVAKADVSVTDDQTGVTPVFDQELSGNGDEVFDPGEVWQYKATGVAADLLDPPDGLKTVPGVCTANGAQPPRTAYVNQGTATIPGASDEADSSYCNPPAPAISILKRTNGQVASDPNGTDVPRIEPGDPVTWTYEVTNTGNVSVPKADLVVTDDQPGVTPVFDQEITGNGDESFDPGEVWQYKATGIAVDLSAPPEGVTTIPEVCTANGTKPPSTAYVNQGKASIPGAESTAESTYCSAELYQIYLPMLKSPGLTRWETSVGFEDLPLESGQNDYDYNDWLVDIDGTVTYDAEIGASGIRRLTFAFLPHSRGASFSHVFHMLFPANVFGSNGTAVITTYDQNLNVVGNQSLPFNATSANDYVIFADTTTVFPGSIVNTIEGKANEPMVPRRTAVLTIDFDTPFSFDLTEFTLDHPHGLGLFFDPYLRVNETATDIHAGDIRMLIIPETSYLWPEEGVRIDQAYPDVTINDGPPPTTSFPPLWWVNFNNCVYDGVVCTP